MAEEVAENYQGQVVTAVCYRPLGAAERARPADAGALRAQRRTGRGARRCFRR